MLTTRSSMLTTAAIVGLMAALFMVYLGASFYFAINIPVWDDYVTHLDIVNTAIQQNNLQGKLSALITPMNSHVPFVPRVLLYVQYLVGVTTPVSTALVVSNLGWAFTTLSLMWVACRSYRIPLVYLLPIPALMLSLSHWEAMDFFSSAFQMYWGSGLFAVLGLIAITRDKPLLTVFCFALGLFTSGGTLAAFPVTLVYLLVTRRWSSLLRFILYTLPLAWLYLSISVPTENVRAFPNLWLLAQYITGFVGNVLANGQWDLTPLAWTHRIIGLFMIGGAIVLCLRIKQCDAPKLVFFYVVIMAGLAGYARMAGYMYPASRYAMYALLALASLYILYLRHRVTSAERPQASMPGAVLALSFLALLLWCVNSWLSLPPLQANRAQKIAAMGNYIKTSDPAQLNSWNAQHAQKVLTESLANGLYNYHTSLDPYTKGQKP